VRTIGGGSVKCRRGYPGRFGGSDDWRLQWIFKFNSSSVLILCTYYIPEPVNLVPSYL
jgi:hypothetical protein